MLMTALATLVLEVDGTPIAVPAIESSSATAQVRWFVSDSDAALFPALHEATEETDGTALDRWQWWGLYACYTGVGAAKATALSGRLAFLQESV
jgi:hypothetical protein